MPEKPRFEREVDRIVRRMANYNHTGYMAAGAGIVCFISGLFAGYLYWG